jgi:hypothetical protein
MSTSVVVRVGAVVDPAFAGVFGEVEAAAARARRAVDERNEARRIYWTDIMGWVEPPTLPDASVEWLARIDTAPDFFRLSGIAYEMREVLVPRLGASEVPALLGQLKADTKGMVCPPDTLPEAYDYLVLRCEVERRLRQLRGEFPLVPRAAYIAAAARA